MTDFTFDGWTVPAGQKGSRMLGGVTLATGSRVGAPCVVVNGHGDGPTLVVTGAVHGFELAGAGAVQALVRSLEPAAVRGTVIGLPVMNPLAVDAGAYASPQDGVNMATPIYWPGNPHGTITERLGAIVAGVLERADVYVDLHGNPEPSAWMSMVFVEQCKDEATIAETRRIAEAFGVTPVDMAVSKAHPAMVGPVSGYPSAVHASRGVPSLLVELADGRTLASADHAARGLRNVMRAVGMLDGGLEPLEAERLPGEYRYYGALQAEAAGLLWVRRPPGTLVKAGDVLLELTDVFGEPAGEVCAPVDGFSWGYFGTLQGMCNHAVPEGAIVGFFAERSR